MVRFRKSSVATSETLVVRLTIAFVLVELNNEAAAKALVTVMLVRTAASERVRVWLLVATLVCQATSLRLCNSARRISPLVTFLVGAVTLLISTLTVLKMLVSAGATLVIVLDPRLSTAMFVIKRLVGTGNAF